MRADLSNVFANRFKNSILLLIITCFTTITTFAFADEKTETYDGIVVENAYIQTDHTKATSQLKLKVSNYSSDDLTLIDVKSVSFEHANLLLQMPGVGKVKVDSLTILQEETLELDTSHISIELQKITHAIKSGDKVEFELVFSEQTIQAFADVHSSKL